MVLYRNDSQLNGSIKEKPIENKHSIEGRRCLKTALLIGAISVSLFFEGAVRFEVATLNGK